MKTHPKLSPAILCLFLLLAACQAGQSPPQEPSPLPVDWSPVDGGQNILLDSQWTCVSGLQITDGSLTIQAGEQGMTFTNRGLPHLSIEGDFGVTATLSSSTDKLAVIQLSQDEHWVILGTLDGQVILGIWNNERAEPYTQYKFIIPPNTTPITLGLRHTQGQFTILANGTLLGQVNDPGIFSTGKVYLGASVGPNNRMTITNLTVESIAGKENSVRIVSIPTIPPASDTTLRGVTDPGGVWVGTSVGVNSLRSQNPYSQALAREFNILTPENSLKFEFVHPEPGRYDFCQADTIAAFAQANGMLMRGHALVWEQQLPPWVRQLDIPREEWMKLLRDHIFTVAGRYQGQIAAWDVVNEAFTKEGPLKDTIWLKNIGPAYLDLAFLWAHEADPNARLFYNDFDSEGLNAKSDAIYALAQDLLARGIPIHGVGMQMHLIEPSPPDPAEVAANFQRLADLGLEVQITEFDVRILEPATPEKLQHQAQIYREIMEVCLAAPNCNTFVMWGLSDRVSWIPFYFEGWGSPLILDEDYQPKPAYDALFEVLSAA
ncbi:MAG: endo-1,4-beta-xylanase, partial [Anaerolineales bacterium]